MAGAITAIPGQDPQLAELMKYSYDDYKGIFSMNPQIQQKFEDHFINFVQILFGRYDVMRYTSELLHILYRLISIKFSKHPRLFEDANNGAETYAHWLKEFVERSDNTPLPEIPRTPEALKYIESLFVAIRFWKGRLHLDRSKTYDLESFDDAEDKIMRGKKDSADEHSFSSVESYRICRALLIYELFCMLFQRHPDTFYNGRVSEQMLFIQALQPFLLNELDAVYGMIECHLAALWRMGSSICRKAVPLDPGRHVTPSSVGLESFMSTGLIELFNMLTSDEFDAGFYATDQAAIDDYFCWWEEAQRLDANVFFNTPLSLYSQRSLAADSVLIPNMVSPDMGRWRGAPNKSNEPSWLSKSFSAHNASSAEYSRIAGLIANDPQNWNGLAFWEKDRFDRHFRLLQSDPVINRAFPIANHDTRPKNAATMSYFRNHDPRKDRSPVALSRQSIATYNRILGPST
ncbi:uncharacterized protein GGS22DRAFT_198118 [Annulohypoxylon maeteangense]|uniref:uncharacterized protein n=1 Tax=Annulohypoxylon maeteangense TaxID=1927788 RepID=UPI00200894D9|nr:uncharacterized protein GGS22DRAFT_198118 [Annulohypoxylon maeteangense]KAI0888342.1 hypothetical protein GGS22DRAFT_198118 [Annulohypoxylon maeteangense]